MSEAEARPSNFIRQIIDKDLADGKHTTVHTVSAGAEWLPAHRSRQVNLSEFRYCSGLSRAVQPAL